MNLGDQGNETKRLFFLALKDNPNLRFVPCLQHASHNADRGATTTALPRLLKFITRYTTAFRNHEKTIDDDLYALQNVNLI